jgi:hypothetical protein
MAVRAQLQAKGGRPRSDCSEREAAAVLGRAAYSLAETRRKIRINGHVAARVTACAHRGICQRGQRKLKISP